MDPATLSVLTHAAAAAGTLALGAVIAARHARGKPTPFLTGLMNVLLATPRPPPPPAPPKP